MFYLKKKIKLVKAKFRMKGNKCNEKELKHNFIPFIINQIVTNRQSDKISP
jgi:hypothetical protein